MSAPLLRFRAMGCDVRVAGATAAEARRIRALFDRHERRFSRFIDGSELNAVNAGAGRAIRVSRAFADMLELSLWAAHQTGGLVDPTIGAALRAAGYDRDFGDGLDRPEPPAPAVAGCWHRIEMRDQLLRVPAGVELDLNGVVKSRAVDEALACLGGEGWISAGGDVAARGAVDVALPGGGAVRLESGGLATSGRGRRTWRRGGRQQHHLIDPGTGPAVADALAAGDGVGRHVPGCRCRRQGGVPAGRRGPGLAGRSRPARSLPVRGRSGRHQPLVANARWSVHSVCT